MRSHPGVWAQLWQSRSSFGVQGQEEWGGGRGSELLGSLTQGLQAAQWWPRLGAQQDGQQIGCVWEGGYYTAASAPTKACVGPRKPGLSASQSQQSLSHPWLLLQVIPSARARAHTHTHTHTQKKTLNLLTKVIFSTIQSQHIQTLCF